MRRSLARSVALLALLLLGPSGLAQAADYPTKAVKIVIPFSAGGAPDVLMRVVAPHLSEKWKQPVIIENRPGANTNIAAVMVAKAEADGHTLLFTSDGTFVFNPLIYASLPYSMSELTPVSLVGSVSFLFTVAAHVPAKSIAEFVALAKSKPRAINYGSSGPASVQRLQMEYFATQTGVTLTHVPFKGANETVTAMLAGQMDASISGTSNVLPHLPGGKLRALAVTTAQRAAQVPDVPTMQEAGVADFDTYSLFGLFAPVGTPPDVIAKIHEDITAVTSLPSVRRALEARSLDVQGKTGKEFQAIIDRDTAKWAKVIKAANIKE